MDLPKPPDDLELKNIIDKLANFVARNGPDFEAMTKEKQKGNARFSFLFGGQHFNYYQYKVTTEQAIMKQQSKVSSAAAQLSGMMLQQPVASQPATSSRWQPAAPQVPIQAGIAPLPGPPPTLPPQITQLQEQLDQMKKVNKEQITQSEQNLAEHYKTLIQRQQMDIDEHVAEARATKVTDLCQECNIQIQALESMAQPIIESCTKDAISNGKNWIFVHSVSSQHAQLIAEYLFFRIMSTESSFELRLHLIYLVNDVLHHCVRKNADDLRLSFESVVIPIFCTTLLSAPDDKKQKLLKLLDLWEQNTYFEPNTLQQLKDPAAALQKFQADQLNMYNDVVQTISAEVNQRYSGLQAQHQDFCAHLNLQAQQLEQQIQALMATLPPPMPTSGQPTSLGLENSAVSSMHMMTSSFSSTTVAPNAAGSLPTTAPPPATPGFSRSRFDTGPPASKFSHSSSSGSGIIVQDYNHGQGSSSGPPATGARTEGGPRDFQLPDLSKPPPGFPAFPAGQPPPAAAPPPATVPEPDLMPTVPYFELPAGLMAPLIKLEDKDYKPLDPKDIRLPPPQPPTERLLAAVEAFYSPPSHERPRDTDGWEKLGLFEFFKAKQRASRRQNGEEDMEGEESYKPRSYAKSRSPSSSRSRSASSQSRSQSRSRSRSRSSDSLKKSRRRSYSESPPYQKASRSRSKSPPPYKRSSRSKSPPPYRRSSRSKSPPQYRRRSKSKTPPPYQRRSRSPSPAPYKKTTRSKSRSKSRTPERRRRSPRARSATPPSMMPMGAGNVFDQKLDYSNKGHQLLAKMGWGGGGLGLNEQGRRDPVEAADIREKQDMYKGLGNDMKDPFEQFRKSKAQGFVQKMQARAREPT